MKTAFKLAGVALACCTSMAMAVEATASLQLTLPALDTHTAIGPGLVNGDWVGYTHPNTNAYAQDGGGLPRFASDYGNPGGDPGGVGEARAEVDRLGNLSSAVGDVRQRALSAHAQADDGTGSVNAANANAGWSREFSLDPGASFTYAATALFASDAAAPSEWSVERDVLSFGYARVGLFNRGADGGALNMSTRIEVSVYNANESFAQTVSLGTSEQARNGLFSITVTNPFTYYLRGHLLAHAYARADSDPNAVIAAPVPEPETWAMMFAGMGLIGAAAAKRRKQAAQ